MWQKDTVTVHSKIKYSKKSKKKFNRTAIKCSISEKGTEQQLVGSGVAKNFFFWAKCFDYVVAFKKKNFGETSLSKIVVVAVCFNLGLRQIIQVSMYFNK